MNYYLYFLLSLPLSFLLASKALHNRKKYFWYDYAALFVLPLVTLYIIYMNEGYKIFIIFIIWCVIGPLLEAVVGYTYLNLAGKHLWVYEKLSLFDRTTSWLSVPFWGFAGAAFYAVDRLVSSL